MKLSVLLIRPGKIHVVKGPWENFESQLEAVTALRAAHPEAMIIPLDVREDGTVCAQVESEFMAMANEEKNADGGEGRLQRQSRIMAAIQGETEIGASLIQRRLQCSYNDAVGILEDLEQQRLILPADDAGKHSVTYLE